MEDDFRYQADDPDFCLSSLYIEAPIVPEPRRMAGPGACAKLLHNQSLVISGCHDTRDPDQNKVLPS